MNEKKQKQLYEDTVVINQSPLAAYRQEMAMDRMAPQADRGSLIEARAAIPAVHLSIYKYAGDYLMQMRGAEDTVIMAAEAWARDHGARRIDWDLGLKAGTLIGLDDVHVMIAGA